MGRCDYDTLLAIIHALRKDRLSIIKANREAVQIAQEFQAIIRQTSPELERMNAAIMAFEMACKKYPDGELVMAFVSDCMKAYGEAKELQAKAPDSGSQGIQQSS